MGTSVSQKKATGRPKLADEELTDFRFTVSLPRSKKEEFESLCLKRGLSKSAISRTMILSQMGDCSS